MLKEAFSCGNKKMAAENILLVEDHRDNTRGREREREREKTASSSRQKGKTRSLSPMRVLDMFLDKQETNKKSSSPSSPRPAEAAPSFIPAWWYRKWKIKNFFLFRSASEGRAASKAQLKKYEVVKKHNNNVNNNNNNNNNGECCDNNSMRFSRASYSYYYEDDDNNNSIGSSVSVASSVSSSMRRLSGPSVSAHELHYTINRAISEEMKKKTSLPYKQQQGLLGCLGFPYHHASSSSSVVNNDFSHRGMKFP